MPATTCIEKYMLVGMLTGLRKGEQRIGGGPWHRINKINSQFFSKETL